MPSTFTFLPEQAGEFVFSIGYYEDAAVKLGIYKIGEVGRAHVLLFTLKDEEKQHPLRREEAVGEERGRRGRREKWGEEPGSFKSIWIWV